METFKIVNSFTKEMYKEFEDFKKFKEECLEMMRESADMIYHVEMWDEDMLIDLSEMNVYFDYE